MRLIAFLWLSFAFLPGAGFASATAAYGLQAASADAQVKAMVRATKWDELLGQLDGLLPSNVVKEYKTLAKDLPYPEMRAMKGGRLMIRYNSHKIIVTFIEDGGVLLNGQPWELKPLSTTQDEVNRIAMFLDEGLKQDALVSWNLLPIAIAADTVAPVVVATATQAGAQKALAQKCGTAGNDPKIAGKCAQMAVATPPVVERVNREMPEKLWPVSLKCPADNQSTLDLISKNSSGAMQRIRVVYKGKSAVRVMLAGNDPGKSYQDIYDINLITDTPEWKEYGQRIVAKGEKFNVGICSASPEERRRNISAMEANKADLAKIEVSSTLEENESEKSKSAN